jgi:cytochrome d ubiquinol oxidase subunit I
VSALDLARWQFGITTVYHFLFVPLTIGLSILVAGMQTAWYRTRNPKYRRMTKFWGKLFLINFAMGVVTGIVQEFQFGMNWSAYSRYVGDIFGAPLAMEGLLAFFLESTFLGLWIFGWDKLSPRMHLATIWLAAIGTNISAYFILAANSWMQHPVGYKINPETHRAELTSIWKVLSNSTVLVGAFPHTITAAFLTAGVFLIAFSAWHLARRNETEVFRTSMRLGLVTTLCAGIAVAVSGDLTARIMTDQQPMKMAAAEALYNTSAPASFSLFTIGSLDGSKEVTSLRVPHVLSFMATGTSNGKVEGINDLQDEYAGKYGPGNYKPNIPTAYWSFRLMIGLGALAGLLSLVGLWLTRRRQVPTSRWFYRASIAVVAAPYVANSLGWIFTEMGRQPWTVFGVLTTPEGVSPTVTAWTVAATLIGFTVLYAALAVVELKLLLRYGKAGPEPEIEPTGDTTEAEREPVFAY